MSCALVGRLEFNEDMAFSVSVLLVGFKKKETLDLFRKMFIGKRNFKFGFISNRRKINVETFYVAIGLKIVVPSTDRLVGMSSEMFLMVKTFIPFRGFLIMA